MIILGRAAGLSDAELRKHAPPGSGRLHAYVVAHEGEATPHSPSEGGGVSIRLGTLAVRAVAAAVRRGLSVFAGHGQTARRKIGEVVSVFCQKIDGKLCAVVLTKMPRPVRSVSMEADLVVDEDGDVTDVRRVSAIAGLDKERPGFPGALKVGEVYCLDGTEYSVSHSEETTMTMSEIRQGIKELNVAPSQVFSLDDLKRDHNPAFSEPIREYGKLKKRADAERAELNQLKSGPRLAEAIKRASLTEKQGEFVEKFAKRTSGYEALDDAGLDALMRSGKELYADAFGGDEIPSEDEQKGGNDDEVADFLNGL